MVMEKIVIKIINSIGSVWSLIIHTVLFILAFVFYFMGYDLTKVLLVLTTIVSLEAIYLSILIQLSVNMMLEKFRKTLKKLTKMMMMMTRMT